MAAEQLLHLVRKLYFAALTRHLKYVQLKGVRTEHLLCSCTSLDIQIDRLVAWIVNNSFFNYPWLHLTV